MLTIKYFSAILNKEIMPKKKTVNSKIIHTNNRTLFIVVGLVVLGEIFFFGYKTLTQAVPRLPQVFMVTDSPLPSGETTMTGTVRKDAQVGKPGNFYLILSSGQPIQLDIQGLDGYLGKTLTVKGVLYPSDTPEIPDALKVESYAVVPGAK